MANDNHQYNNSKCDRCTIDECESALAQIARILWKRRDSGAVERKSFGIAIRALGYGTAAEFARWNCVGEDGSRMT